MGFFSKRDRSKNGASRQEDDLSSQQHYLAIDSASRPELTLSPPSASASTDAPSNGGRGRSGGLKGFRSSRKQSGSEAAAAAAAASSSPFGPGSGKAPLLFRATDSSSRVLARFPDVVLARVFASVCPHSQDDAYETCEESSRGNACMLCDMRDLAHCTRVCRRWRALAEQVFIRIDSVHYCEREAILSDKRKRRSFFDRNAEPENTPASRLQLLCRTLRDNTSHHLGRWVQLLKLPYMLRESNYVDIARTVSVLPNLRYVDLPEGLFVDEPLYASLRREIQAKCPDLRKMTYVCGAERHLEALASGMLWRNLEVLELVRIGADPALLRQVLGSLPNLRALKVTEAITGQHTFTDDVLLTSPVPSSQDRFSSFPGFSVGSPNVPPLEELILTDTRNVTADGLLDYLSRTETRRALRVLTLSGTGVKPWALQAILAQAPSLRHLTIVDDVFAALPVAAGTHEIQPLLSASLQTLNYEIQTASGVSVYAGVTRSYYNYLSGSILSGGLPNLRVVYVRDAQFPELLMAGTLAPPRPVLGGEFGSNRRPASAGSSSPSASAFRSPQSTGGQAPLYSPGAISGSSPRSPGPAPFAPSTGANPFLDPQAGSSSASSAAAPAGMSLAPPSAPWTAGHNPRFSSNNPFAGMISPQKMQMLEVFTKGDDDLDWSSILVSGADGDAGGTGIEFGGGGGSSSRPVSSYGLGADLGAVGAHKSVLINVGPGNYLALPDDGGGGAGGSSSSGGGGQGQDLWPRPKSSSGVKKSEKFDLWR